MSRSTLLRAEPSRSSGVDVDLRIRAPEAIGDDDRVSSQTRAAECIADLRQADKGNELQNDALVLSTLNAPSRRGSGAGRHARDSDPSRQGSV